MSQTNTNIDTRACNTNWTQTPEDMGGAKEVPVAETAAVVEAIMEIAQFLNIRLKGK